MTRILEPYSSEIEVMFLSKLPIIEISKDLQQSYKELNAYPAYDLATLVRREIRLLGWEVKKLVPENKRGWKNRRLERLLHRLDCHG